MAEGPPPRTGQEDLGVCRYPSEVLTEVDLFTRHGHTSVPTVTYQVGLVGELGPEDYTHPSPVTDAGVPTVRLDSPVKRCRVRVPVGRQGSGKCPLREDKGYVGEDRGTGNKNEEPRGVGVLDRLRESRSGSDVPGDRRPARLTVDAGRDTEQ